MIVKSYKEKIIPTNCNPKNIRKLKKIIDGSKSYGRKHMFNDVKDPEEKERLLDNFFE